MASGVARTGVENYEFVSFASGHEEASIRTQSNRVWPHPGQFDLQAGRRQLLIDRCLKSIRAKPANDLDFLSSSAEEKAENSDPES